MTHPHRVSRAFRAEPRRTRALVAMRGRAAPWAAIDAALGPPSGRRLLDIGCGLGVGALGWARSGWEVHAVDTDARRVAALRRAATSLGVEGRITAEVVSLDWCGTGAYDAVALIDVVYLRPPAERAGVVSRHAERVAPGGRMVVMELGDEPRHKVAVARLQEGLALSRVGWTPSPSTGRPPVAMRRLAEEGVPSGFEVDIIRCDAGRPWPHTLIVATRRGDS